MSDKKQSAKRKWKNALLAAALTASVILALPAWSVGPAEAALAPSERLALKEDGTTIVDSTLTIKRAGTDPAKQGTIEIDLYKVAGAVKVSGYDAYELKMSDAQKTFYGSEIAAALESAQKAANKENAAYRALAQQAAGKIFVETTDPDNAEKKIFSIAEGADTMKVKVDPPVTIKTTETPSFTGLEAGMYLVIAHGAGLTASQYVGKNSEQLVTMAYNNGYAYSFLPELISLPMKGTIEAGETVYNAEDGIFTTAQNAGDWQYAVTAELKAEETVQMHDLTITKVFDGPDGMTLPGNDGCIFQVDAVLNDQTVYSKVVTISYGGQHSVTLTDVIPEGATVTVKEVYDGASFGVTGGDTKTNVQNGGITQGTDGTYMVSFTDTYNGTGTGGGIVENRFTRTDSGYDHTPVYDSDINPNPQ